MQIKIGEIHRWISQKSLQKGQLRRVISQPLGVETNEPILEAPDLGLQHNVKTKKRN